MKPIYTVGYGETRGFTNGVFALMDEGYMNASVILQELLCWMSEDEVAQFVKGSWLFRDEENECVVRASEEEEVEEEEFY
jgi:hypothetical protein